MYRVYLIIDGELFLDSEYANYKRARRQWQALRNEGEQAVILQPN